MIIWLASYPKSGNTWVRIFLSYIINSQNVEEINDEILKKIRNYPLLNHDFSKELKEKFTDKINTNDENYIKEKFFKNWITSQQKLNLNNKINILKTHNMLCKMGEHKFTDLENTIAAIHIVRDPRNVLTSVKNHYSKENYEEAKNFLVDDYRWIGTDNNIIEEIPTFIGSWKTHFLSWKRFPKNYILIKYEDLLNNPNETFGKIVDHIKQFIELDVDEKKIEKAIKVVSFENLKKLEQKEIFKESIKDKKTGQLKKFFYLGPKNDWRNILNKNISDEISKRFELEMKELGYI